MSSRLDAGQLRGLADRWSASLPGRGLRRFSSISGYDRALALAAQAFLAVIPILVVVGAAAGGSTDALSESLIRRFGLSGTTADLVAEALHPPDTSSASLWGASVLVVSALGFTRALQRSYRAAWSLQAPAGWQGWLAGVGGALALAAGVVLGAALASALPTVAAGAMVLLVLRAVISATLWLLASRVLLGGSVDLRQLAPGAVVAGLGQSVVSLLSSVWMPRALGSQGSSYGVIGICSVLITWFLLLGLLVVAAAVVSAELARPPAGGR